MSIRFLKYKKSHGQKKALGGHSVKCLFLLPVCLLSPFVIRAAISHSCLGYLCSENLSARRVNGSTPFLLYNMRWFGKYNTFFAGIKHFYFLYAFGERKEYSISYIF